MVVNAIVATPSEQVRPLQLMVAVIWHVPAIPAWLVVGQMD